MLTIKVTNETSSPATKISRFVSENDQAKQLFTLIGWDDRRDHLTKGDNPLLYHFAINTKAIVSSFLFMNFKYQDIAETKYNQRVICIYDKDYGVEIHPSLPELITE
jgi:hypothetical protein